MKKRKKIPQIIGHAGAPATEGSHPLRHNFAEELGSNDPEKYSMATIEAVFQVALEDNVYQGHQEVTA